MVVIWLLVLIDLLCIRKWAESDS